MLEVYSLNQVDSQEFAAVFIRVLVVAEKAQVPYAVSPSLIFTPLVLITDPVLFLRLTGRPLQQGSTLLQVAHTLKWEFCRSYATELCSGGST